MARDLAAVDNLLATTSRSIAWIKELSAGTREIRGELERIATVDGDRSPITFAEFMDALNEVRRIERTVIRPGVDMVERDLDSVRRYLAEHGEAVVVGHAAVVNALANRLERSCL